MPLSKSAIAWAVSGTIGVGTCMVGFAALNSGAPASADPRPAITVAGMPTDPATDTASAAPTADSSVSARSTAVPVSPKSPASPPSPITPASPRSADDSDD